MKKELLFIGLNIVMKLNRSLLELEGQKTTLLKQRKKHPKLSTHHLVSEWQKATMDPEAQALIISKNSFMRRLNRARGESNEHPKVPGAFEDFEYLPDKYEKTFDGDRFCIANMWG
jgi:hypothetical protein